MIDLVMYWMSAGIIQHRVFHSYLDWQMESKDIERESKDYQAYLRKLKSNTWFKTKPREIYSNSGERLPGYKYLLLEDDEDIPAWLKAYILIIPKEDNNDQIHRIPVPAN